MARRRVSKRNKNNRKKSDVFSRVGAAWENETRDGDAMINVRVSIEEFLDYLDEIKLDDLPDEDTKLSFVLLENTKYPGKGKPDFVMYGSDPVLPEGETEEKEEEEKPRRRRGKKTEKPEKKSRRSKREEPEDDDDPDLDLD